MRVLLLYMVEYIHMSSLFLYGFLFILGIIIGSFLNVVILRLHTNKISKGRSRCERCAHILSPKDLIPVLSHLFLGGRCRYCKSRISAQYPLVEIITAVMFVLVFWKVSNTFDSLWQIILFFIIYVKIFSILIVMSVYDIRHFILPWKLMRPFLLITFVLSILLSILNNDISIETFASGFIVALPFWMLWYFSKGRLIGFGDIELMCGIGFMMGIMSGILSVFMGFWIGAFFVFIKILASRKMLSGKTQIPFGPFLVAGVFVTFILGISFDTFLFSLM